MEADEMSEPQDMGADGGTQDGTSSNTCLLDPVPSRTRFAARARSLHAVLVLVAAALLLAQCIPPEPDGRRLRDIVMEDYPEGSLFIGATDGSDSFTGGPTNDSRVMDREYMYVTPENDFKQHTIHPEPGVWDWSRPDPWKDHVAANDQVLRMHCPIGPQCSVWAKEDARTALELEQNLREFMQSVCIRYNDASRILWMDVVNETVIQGAWHRNKEGSRAWECPWFLMGQDGDPNRTPRFIRIAFEIATEYAPDIKLIFNHHEGPNVEASWELIRQTVSYLRGLGLRVDGIGWQAHVDAGVDTPENLDRLRALIDWAHANDLEFHVTEASVWMKNGNTAEEREKQAATYANILSVLLEKRASGVVAWNTWHIADVRTWHPEWFPALFDAFYRAKPAYYALQEVLENPP